MSSEIRVDHFSPVILTSSSALVSDLHLTIWFYPDHNLTAPHTSGFGTEHGRIRNRNPHINGQTTQTVFHSPAGPGLVRKDARETVGLAGRKGAATSVYVHRSRGSEDWIVSASETIRFFPLGRPSHPRVLQPQEDDCYGTESIPQVPSVLPEEGFQLVGGCHAHHPTPTPTPN